MAKVTNAQWRAKHPVINELLDGKLTADQMHFIEQAIKAARKKALSGTGIRMGSTFEYTDKCPQAELMGQTDRVIRVNQKTYSTANGYRVPLSWATSGFIRAIH